MDKMIKIINFKVLLLLYLLFFVNTNIFAGDYDGLAWGRNISKFNHPQISLSVKALCSKDRDVITPNDSLSEKQFNKDGIQRKEYIWEDVKLYVRYYRAPSILLKKYNNRGFVLWFIGDIYENLIKIDQDSSSICFCDWCKRKGTTLNYYKNLNSSFLHNSKDSLNFEICKFFPKIQIGDGYNRYGEIVFIEHDKINPLEPFTITFDVYRCEDNKGPVSKRVKLNPDYGLIEVK